MKASDDILVPVLILFVLAFMASSVFRATTALYRIAAAVERVEKTGLVTVKTVHERNVYSGLPGIEQAGGLHGK
jgi:hypothetical protein